MPNGNSRSYWAGAASPVQNTLSSKHFEFETLLVQNALSSKHIDFKML